MDYSTLTDARARGELGAARAANRAGEGWKIAALAAVEAYCIAHPGETFMAEQIREWATHVPPPPDGRAWGHVMQAARRYGIIEAAGYAPAVSSNGSPKVLWRRA